MIFADANVFLRYFVQAQTAQDRQMALQAKELFARAESGAAQKVSVSGEVELPRVMRTRLYRKKSQTAAKTP